MRDRLNRTCFGLGLLELPLLELRRMLVVGELCGPGLRNASFRDTIGLCSLPRICFTCIEVMHTCLLSNHVTHAPRRYLCVRHQHDSLRPPLLVLLPYLAFEILLVRLEHAHPQLQRIPVFFPQLPLPLETRTPLHPARTLLQRTARRQSHLLPQLLPRYLHL